MQEFSVDGLKAQLDDDSDIFTFGEKWYHLAPACFVLVGIASLFLIIPVAGFVAALRGEISGGEGLVGLQRVAWWGFVLVLWAVFALFFLAGVALLRVVAGYIVFGTRPHVLDRWTGRFRIGRRDICGLSEISAVVLTVNTNSDSNEDRFYIEFRLKDGRDLPLRHLGHYGLKNENAERFIAELARFLKVPILKLPSTGLKDPLVAELTELLSDAACLVRLPKKIPGTRYL